jgi:hypothetical protein
VTLADTYRLPVFRQELRYRHFWEWTTLAENQWTHDGRKLTGNPEPVPEGAKSGSVDAILLVVVALIALEDAVFARVRVLE